MSAAEQASAGARPDADMMAPVERLARFIAGGDGALLPLTFASGPVTIVENFAPYLFEGPGAVEAWAAGMREHAAPLSALNHEFGAAFDFGGDGDRAFFSLPTTWRGVSRGAAFVETGGWALVLARAVGVWRIRGYGWAVTGLSPA